MKPYDGTAKEAYFWLDDSQEPGLAKVEVLRPRRLLRAGERVVQTFSVKVLEVLRPSFARYRVGQVCEVAATHLGQD